MQRAHYSKRRKEIWEALHPEPMAGYGREDGEDEENNSGASCATIPGRSPGRPKQFAAATAEVTGQSKAQINRSVARAEAIGDDLLRLGPMWAGVGVKNAWGGSGRSTTVQRTLVQVVL